MEEKDFFDLKNYRMKKQGVQLFGDPSYLSHDGQYVGGRATAHTADNKGGVCVHYLARYDGMFAAYTLAEMVEVEYDDETRTWESFAHSTGNSAITAMVGPGEYEWCLKGYDDYPKLLKGFRLGDTWRPSEAHRSE